MNNFGSTSQEIKDKFKQAEEQSQNNNELLNRIKNEYDEFLRKTQEEQENYKIETQQKLEQFEKERNKQIEELKSKYSDEFNDFVNSYGLNNAENDLNTNNLNSNSVQNNNGVNSSTFDKTNNNPNDISDAATSVANDINSNGNHNPNNDPTYISNPDSSINNSNSANSNNNSYKSVTIFSIIGIIIVALVCAVFFIIKKKRRDKIDEDFFYKRQSQILNEDIINPDPKPLDSSGNDNAITIDPCYREYENVYGDNAENNVYGYNDNTNVYGDNSNVNAINYLPTVPATAYSEYAASNDASVTPTIGESYPYSNYYVNENINQDCTQQPYQYQVSSDDILNVPTTNFSGLPYVSPSYSNEACAPPSFSGMNEVMDSGECINKSVNATQNNNEIIKEGLNPSEKKNNE